MKTAKKIMALVIVAVMMLAMSTTALAVQTIGTESGTTGSVTISNATVGEKYQGYQIFKATVARNDSGTPEDYTDDTSSSIVYLWAGTGSMPTNSYFGADPVTGYITATASAGTTDLSEGAIALLKSWVGTDNTAYSFPTTSETTATDTELKFAGLNYGYWYFTSTLGTVVTVNSTNPNVSVTDKNEKPTIDKTVQEDSTGTYQKQNDGEIGQTVNFQTIVSAKKGGSGYILYDKMGTGLTFDGVSSIHVYKGSISAENEVTTSATTWTAVAGGAYYNGGDTAGNTATEDGTASFVLTFADAYTEALTENTTFIVTYTATINSDAIVNTAIPNDTTLKYGDANYTAESETKTYVWGTKIVKYTGEDVKTGTKLANAQFVIYKTGTEEIGGVSTAVVYYAKVTNGKLTGWTVADATPLTELPKKDVAYFTDTSTILTSDANGVINVAGLDEGTYYLLEIKAPDGYNKLTEAKTLTITSTSGTNGSTLETALTSGTDGVTEIDVQNNTGTELPSTGGIGTTIFYVAGGVLVVAAVVLLVTKKRMSGEK